MALRLYQIQYGTTTTVLNFPQERGECQLEIHSKGNQIWFVFHHGEPCTLRWTKNIIFAKKRMVGLVPPVLDSLDNYKILSERMNVLTILIFPGGIEVP